MFASFSCDFYEPASSMWSFRRRCTFPHNRYIPLRILKGKNRFVDCEKWRKEFGPKGLDDLVRNFEYTEKAQVFEYYPQFYHKTDKVLYLPP